MTEERDPESSSGVSRRYRELGAEAPPRALDEAILAASRRTSHAGLRRAVPSFTRRWGVPLSLAAVVVLSVTVTLNLQHEQPGVEQPQAVATAPKVLEAPAPAEEPAAKALKGPASQAPAREDGAGARKDAFTPDPPRVAAAPAPQTEPAASQAAPAAPPSAAPMQERSTRDQAGNAAMAGAAGDMRARESREAPAARSAPEARSAPAPARAEATAKLAVAETPEKELERIATLRRDGRHDEADQALKDFRKRYPDFRIPAETLEKIERR